MGKFRFILLTAILLALTGCRPAPAPSCPTPIPPSSPKAITPENVAQLTEVRRLNAGEYVNRVAFDPQGDLLAAAIQGKVLLWQVSDGRMVRTLEMPDDEVWSLTFSPDGSLLAAGTKGYQGADNKNRKSKVLIWKVADGSLMRVLEDPTNEESLGYMGYTTVTDVAFSPDGTLLAAVTRRGVVGLWRMADGALLHAFTLEPYGRPSVVAFSPDGRMLAAASEFGQDPLLGNPTLPIWRVADGSLLKAIKGPQRRTIFPHSLAFSSDGSLLGVGGLKGWYLWRVRGGAPVCMHWLRPDNPNEPLAMTSVAFDPHWGVVAGGMLYHGDVLLWRMADEARLRTLEHKGNDRINWVIFSPDGSLLAVALPDGTVRLWGVR